MRCVASAPSDTRDLLVEEVVVCTPRRNHWHLGVRGRTGDGVWREGVSEGHPPRDAGEGLGHGYRARGASHVEVARVEVARAELARAELARGVGAARGANAAGVSPRPCRIPRGWC